MIADIKRLVIGRRILVIYECDRVGRFVVYHIAQQKIVMAKNNRASDFCQNVFQIRHLIFQLPFRQYGF